MRRAAADTDDDIAANLATANGADHLLDHTWRSLVDKVQAPLLGEKRLGIQLQHFGHDFGQDFLAAKMAADMDLALAAADVPNQVTIGR